MGIKLLALKERWHLPIKESSSNTSTKEEQIAEKSHIKKVNQLEIF